MNREHAEAALRKGYHVRHKSWSMDGWISMRGDLTVIDNNGSVEPWRAFGWPDGWSIVEPAPTPTPGTVLPLSECGVGWLVRLNAGHPPGRLMVYGAMTPQGDWLSPHTPVTLLSAAPGWTPVGEGDPQYDRPISLCWSNGDISTAPLTADISAYRTALFWRDASHDAQDPVEPGVAWHDLVIPGIVKVGDRVRVSWVTQGGDTKHLFHVGDVCEVGLGDTGSGPKYLAVQTRHGGFIAPRGDRVTFEVIAPVEPDLAARVAELERKVESLEGIVNVLAGESRSASDLERAYSAAKAAGKFDATTFRTSRKPDAPGDDSAMKYALNLAETLRMEYYPEADNFQPLSTLAGVLTQIDNMVSGIPELTRQSVLAQLAANEERAVNIAAGLFPGGYDANVAKIRAALAAIREGL